jgi:hypothetical protein
MPTEVAMGEISASPGHAPVLRGTISGDGTPGPIEERMGRRLLRLVDPCSEEGERLLHAGLVDLVGPGGEKLGRIPMEDARLRLAARLQEWLLEAQESVEQELVRESLDRLLSGSRNVET